MEDVRITTVDNPYDPFDEWEEWLMFDISKGYHTCEALASVTYTSDQLSDEENNEAIDEGIDELIKTGAISKTGEIVEYKKVYRKKNDN